MKIVGEPGCFRATVMTGNRQGCVEHLTKPDGFVLKLHEYGIWCAPNQADSTWTARQPFQSLARNALISWVTEITLFGFGNILGTPEKC